MTCWLAGFILFDLAPLMSRSSTFYISTRFCRFFGEMNSSSISSRPFFIVSMAPRIFISELRCAYDRVAFRCFFSVD